jgi:hypothetical protein
MFFSMAVGTKKEALIKFLFHLIPRHSVSIAANAELFLLWVAMMKVKRIYALIVAASFTLSSLVLDRHQLHFDSSFLDTVFVSTGTRTEPLFSFGIILNKLFTTAMP